MQNGKHACAGCDEKAGDRGAGGSKKKQRGIVPVRELAVLSAATAVFAAGLLSGSRLHFHGYHWLEYAVFAPAYLLAGWNVLSSALKNIVRGKLFNEHFLMTVATLGALAIHAIPEAVGVMIFYKIGELLESLAVGRSRRSIDELLRLRPSFARLNKSGGPVEVPPEQVRVGEEVSVRPGERVPLDGTVTTGAGYMDTSALTGEGTPRRVGPGAEVLAGFISRDGSLTVRVTKTAGESSAAKIIRLVEEASHAKAGTERFITGFARVYTPAVVAGAALIAFLPPLLLGGEVLSEWVYRALIMLVISCPCALVLSVPLAYFGGIGGASRRGILVKGAKFLDALAAVKTVVFDKTGTLTKGVFSVTSICPADGRSADELLRYAALAESNSNHPISFSIREAYGRPVEAAARGFTEEGGFGVSAEIEGHAVLAGNDRLMHREGIPHGRCDVGGTAVHLAVDGDYAGYLVIGDELKHDAGEAVGGLRKLGVDRVAMLTGDSREAGGRAAAAVDISECHAELLPADKVSHLERIMADRNRGEKTAFVGDGVNDAPVLARSDVGIAMGGSGSDAAVETADVVLMTDDPLRVAEAIRRARGTRRIVIQNIVFALAVKAVFLALGAAGEATMWEAVMADVGVTLAAVLNASRAMR